MCYVGFFPFILEVMGVISLKAHMLHYNFTLKSFSNKVSKSNYYSRQIFLYFRSTLHFVIALYYVKCIKQYSAGSTNNNSSLYT